jgi:hypothetical protein
MLENSTTIGLETLAEHIKHEIGQHDDYISPTAFRSMQSILHLREHILLESVNISLTSIAATDAGTVDVVCGVGLSAPNLPTDPYKFGSAIARPVLNFIVSVYDLEYIAYILDRVLWRDFWSRAASKAIAEHQHQMVGSSKLSGLDARQSPRT